jgi:hypothetical protein
MKNFVNKRGGLFIGGFSILVVLGSNVANFIKQVVIFSILLYFFITSEIGGMMEQALEMVPLSEVTRQKCTLVLDRTISVVLLTTGKLMLFQVLLFLICITYFFAY